MRMAVMRDMVLVERGETSWGAHVPDLPGRVAVGGGREEPVQLIREAIEFHIGGLKEHGLPVPAPGSEGEFVEVGSA
jgi:predicted RNase H-like HicB family nuclease